MRARLPLTCLLLLAALPAGAAESFGSSNYYLGDLHSHTGLSGDGGSADLGDCEGSCGTLADVFATARANGLDFVAITDHINSTPSLSATEWDTLQARVVAENDPEGGFVTIPGGEIWFTLSETGARLGHKTLLLFGDDEQVAPVALTDIRINAGSTVVECGEIWAWIEGLAAGFGDAMLIPHHPAVQMPMYTDWTCHDPTWEPAVEVYSEHGNSLDEAGYDTPGAGVYSAGTVHAALDPAGYGLLFGFVSGTDSHDSRPGGVCAIDTEQPTHLYGGGLTVAVLDGATPFDRAAVGTAIRTRSTYVTTGPALPMEVTWSADGIPLGGLGQGIAAPESFDLEATVRVPADRAGHVLSVELVGPSAQWALLDDGAGTWSGAVPAGEVPPWLYVAVQIDGASWYAGEDVCQDGGDTLEWLWGSPSPISLWEDDADGDGASAWRDDCDDTDATVFPGAAERWYDGLDQDCADDSDYDQDGDGFDSAAWGGPDCDDANPEAAPGLAERWYDGVDQDCDPATEHDADADGVRFPHDCDDQDATRTVCDAVPRAPPGCISIGTSDTSGVSLVLVALLAARRRRGQALSPTGQATPVPPSPQ